MIQFAFSSLLQTQFLFSSARRVAVLRTMVLLAIASPMFFASVAFAQSSSVIVKLRQPPPNQFRVADLWELTLINTGRTTLTVFLVGTLDEERDGRVAQATSGTIQLAPGTKVFSRQNYRELEPINVESNVPRYRDIFLQTGGAPSGSYTICISVRAVPSGGEITSDCIQQQIENVSQPLLVFPSDGSEIETKLPVFSWTLPAPFGQGRSSGITTYTVRIVEVLGRQSPVAAMQTNAAWYEQENVRSPALQYGVGARELQPGKRYAWSVSAFRGGSLLGQSEVWEFTYKPTARIKTPDIVIRRDITAPPPPPVNITPVVTVQPPLPFVIAVTKKRNINVDEELLKSCNGN